MFDDAEVISIYPLQQAIDDGVLVEILKHRWKALTGGKPIVATRAVYSEISIAGIMEIWNEYIEWRKKVQPTLPEEEQTFTTEMNSKTVWVLEGGDAFTILYPVEY